MVVVEDRPRASHAVPVSERFSLTGRERILAEGDMIVSKTDTRGIITYANKSFVNICGYAESELIGAPHSIIRHPHMPRCVFKLLWDTIQSGEEIFAYVVNRCKNGDHYWVFAHVTPSYDKEKRLVGYHSSRRAPRREPINILYPVYRQLCEIEAKIGGQAGINASLQGMVDLLKEKQMNYDEFIMSL